MINSINTLYNMYAVKTIERTTDKVINIFFNIAFPFHNNTLKDKYDKILGLRLTTCYIQVYSVT